MSFLVSCPTCGPRGVYEFRHGGEYKPRPASTVATERWAAYLYLKANVAGVQEEWWFHRAGCQRWFKARRDTRTNRMLETRATPAIGPVSEPDSQATEAEGVEP